MNIGTYGQESLADARKIAKVALGHDVAADKQERKAEALAKIEAKKGSGCNLIAETQKEALNKWVISADEAALAARLQLAKFPACSEFP